MSTCPACKSEVADSGRFCSSCGSLVVVGSEDATFDFAPATPAGSTRGTSAFRPPSSEASRQSDGMFLPGSVVAGRYRIITLLGRGGMGEVYRADDLTLGQPVALKFLPSRAGSDEGLLERFRNEVRVARKVSHPNVCRVYDVGDVDGQAFFTMEYVDGEDLASLLRRIGRLPQDKALDIARQLCAGLAAAHAKGVLHRDMKPANVMLDGRGQVVITDFGLAGVVGQIQGADVRSGTPAYMAPEQLAGEEVSVRSDIYSLGLVLYEVFTGKRALSEKSTVAERLRGEQNVSRPSSVVRDLDPVVERVILRCLETVAAARPASVLSVAAALPGGDPLAAALAAGETPSPQLVAASGETTGLRPRVAVACFAAVLLGIAGMIYLTIRTSALEKMSLDQSPEVLTQKARDIVVAMGYARHPADSAHGLYANGDLSEEIEKTDKPHPDWDRILSGGRPSLMQYWYRQSPRYMVPTTFGDLMLTPGRIRAYDPPQIVSGMVNVELDPQGRLIYFQAIPPELETTREASSPAAFDWNKLFAAAGLEMSQFQSALPLWNSVAGGDTRSAWTGTWPGTSRPLRIEAASSRGKPVFFSLIGSWTKPERAKADDQTLQDKIRNVLGVILLASMVVAAALLARRNYRQGRGDRAGAARLATVMFGLVMLLWLCRCHFVPDLSSFFFFVLAISTGLSVTGTTWLLYLALEPWVRRQWPRTMISWSRLISGNWQDALVGRDLLFGVILGVAWIFVFRIRDFQLLHIGGAPSLYPTEYLLGGREALGMWLFQIPSAIIGALEFFFVLLGLKVLLRREWIAAVVFVAIFSALNSLGSQHPAVEIPTAVIVYLVAVIGVVRFGLVALTCAIFTVDMLGNVPFSADLSAWYMSTSVLATLTVVVLAGWGFYRSLGGEPLWRPEVD
jgi:serine/threonine-protein kinase